MSNKCSHTEENGKLCYFDFYLNCFEDILYSTFFVQASSSWWEEQLLKFLVKFAIPLNMT